MIEVLFYTLGFLLMAAFVFSMAARGQL